MATDTKNSIKLSFFALLKERPLNKITVKDVVEHCGVNRNSFYYYFSDIPQLIEDAVTDEIDGIVRKYRTINTFDECLRVAMEFGLKNKKIVLNMYNSVNRDIFERYLWRICRYVSEVYLNTVLAEKNYTEADMSTLIKFYACQIFGQVACWLESGMTDDVVQDSERLCRLRKDIIDVALEDQSASHRVE